MARCSMSMGWVHYKNVYMRQRKCVRKKLSRDMASFQGTPESYVSVATLLHEHGLGALQKLGVFSTCVKGNV